ncbi:hypothetical protein AAFF_G00363060 [Aldrovandia affinis]|uniref:Uncharacterized protein n=1 Tax=Aldrovandia affinis TaxID=143900 RepID=A0AAD7R4W0_9TELE|nr:hypothetical protein AAFF_G00363060 [Aldrovandia affinis]
MSMDGEKTIADDSWRFCVDYQRLNAVTRKDSYPLPRINDTLDHISGSRWFSSLDQRLPASGAGSECPAQGVPVPGTWGCTRPGPRPFTPRASIPSNKRNLHTPVKTPRQDKKAKKLDGDSDSLSPDLTVEKDPSSSAILEAVKNIAMVEGFNSHLNENTLAIANMVKSLDFSSKEIQDCKDKLMMLEKQVSVLTAENQDLKQRVLENERYRRCWNLRIHGLKENEGENTRERIIQIMSKIAPQWAGKMEEVVDSTHCLGRKVEGKNRH